MEDNYEEYCNTGLCLGLGSGHVNPKKDIQKKQKVVSNKHMGGFLDLAFHLCPKGEAINNVHHNSTITYANSTTDDSDHSNNDYCRKKLRLTKEQSLMLENTFNLHNTLNSVQKQALADQLNLKTRQIEVWFQNRRARTKVKQTEVDYELLKKHCQNLSDENRKLKKELQELRALKLGGGGGGGASSSPPNLCIQLSKAATLAVCSSCDKLLMKHQLLNQGKNNNNNNK